MDWSNMVRSGQCAAPALCCLMSPAPHGRSASQQLSAATQEIMKWTAGYISPESVMLILQKSNKWETEWSIYEAPAEQAESELEMLEVFFFPSSPEEILTTKAPRWKRVRQGELTAVTTPLFPLTYIVFIEVLCHYKIFPKSHFHIYLLTFYNS